MEILDSWRKFNDENRKKILSLSLHKYDVYRQGKFFQLSFNPLQEPSTVSNDESTLPPRIDNQLCFRILFSHCLFAKLIAYVNLCTKAKVSKMLEYCILAFICQIVLFVCTFNELFAPYLMRFETHAYPHIHTHTCA